MKAKNIMGKLFQSLVRGAVSLLSGLSVVAVAAVACVTVHTVAEATINNQQQEINNLYAGDPTSETCVSPHRQKQAQDLPLISPRRSRRLTDLLNNNNMSAGILMAPGRRCFKGSRSMSWDTFWAYSSVARRHLLNVGEIPLSARIPKRALKKALKSAGYTSMHQLHSVNLANAFKIAWGELFVGLPLKAIALPCQAALILTHAVVLTVISGVKLMPWLAPIFLIGCQNENTTTIQYADAGALLTAIATVSIFTNLGKLVVNVNRKQNNIPKTKLTIIKGSEEAPKITLKASTTDCLGLDMFGHHLGLPILGQDDVLFLEAKGVAQSQIKKVVRDLVKDGYRPIGARTFIRVRKDGQASPGAEYIYAMSAIFGSLVNLRSYGSMMNAPALNPFEVKGDIYTERGNGEKKRVLFISGSAKKLNKMFNGIEGGIPVSEKAAEAIFGDKLPSQPRVLIKKVKEMIWGGKTVDAGSLQKGKISLLAARIFYDVDGKMYAKCRADFDDSDLGKAAWREGYDFWLIEDDTPKGLAADELKTVELKTVDSSKVDISGWRLAKAPLKSGSSLVSYQVLALLAMDAGFGELASEINALVTRSVDRDVAKCKRDLDALLKGAPKELKDYFAAQAPGSAKSARRNFLGFGAKTITGYIDMNSAFSQGYVVTGNKFGPGWAKSKRSIFKALKSAKAKAYALLDLAGGKNPILDFNQTWVGKNVYLGQIFEAIEEYRFIEEAKANPDLGEIKLSPECQAFLNAFMAKIPEDERLNNLKWIAAYAPALSRGSIMMNCDDVALLAGDDDGDQLWFSFNKIFISIFKRIHRQNAGGNSYKIEIDKRCQLVSDFGPRPISDLVDVEDEDDLWNMCLYMIAPNKGQGPVGYLANLCTVLIAVFKKIDAGSGLLKFAIKFVELLQAVLNLMAQTSIDLQKREYGAIDPTRWSEADISTATVGLERALIPGYDFPILNFHFDKQGFDPYKFTKEEYKARLSRKDVPNIINHWTGKKMSFLTDNDSQYNVGALGSWLVLEILSLIVTGKPFQWNEGAVGKGAEGGLTQNKVKSYLSEDGPDIESFLTCENIPAEKHALIKMIWVEKPSLLYRWKKASKNKKADEEVPMPPALRVCWNLAFAAKEAHKPKDYEPSISFNSLKAALKGSLALPLRKAKPSLVMFVDMWLDRFYVEAVRDQELKTNAERFQNAEERSGIESLRLLLRALEELIKDQVSMGFSSKKAQAVVDILNPRKKTKKLEKKLQAISWMLAWYDLHNENLWRWKQVQRVLPKEADMSLKDILRREIPNLDEAQRNLLLNEGRGDASINEHLDAYLEKNLSEKELMRLHAKSTFFIDEGIPALRAVTEQEAIITEKRYMLRQVGKLIQWYKLNRRDLTDPSMITAQIILHAFNGGKCGTEEEPSWLRKIRDDLQSIVEVVEVAGSIDVQIATIDKQKAELKAELKADDTTNTRKSEIRKEFKDLKGKSYGVQQAQNIKILLDRTKKEGSKKPAEILQLWCDPKMNPLASRFTELLKDSCTPLVNVERSWNFNGGKKGWELILGTKKTVETQEGSKDIFWGFSRVDFQLPDRVEAGITRIFLNAGTSIYKLNQVPGTNIKTWRYFDACIASAEDLSDWSIVRGFGHLVSLAKPTKDSKDRLNHIGYLKADIKKVTNANIADTSKKNEYLSNAKAELSRIEDLSKNPLMYRWGQGLLVPVTWGLRLANYWGDTTEEKLNGRGYNAIALLNKDNSEFVHQGTYKVLNTKGKIACGDNGEHLSFDSIDKANKYGLEQYGKANFKPGIHENRIELKPNSDVIIQGRAGEDIGQLKKNKIGAVTPYQSFFNHSSFREEAGGLDKYHDLPLRTLGKKSRYADYDEWMTAVERWAVGGESKDLLLGCLFYKSNLGAIGMLMTDSKEYRSQMIARLMRCASRDARLHIEILLNSKAKSSVVAEPLDRKSVSQLAGFLEDFEG